MSWAATLGAYIWNGPDALVNQHIFKVESYIDKRFHKYLLDYKLDELMSHTHGSGMVHITRPQFDGLLVAIPSMEEQRRIVDLLEYHLSHLEAAVTSCKAAQERFGAYSASVLQSAMASVHGQRVALGTLLRDSRTGWDRSRSFVTKDALGIPYLKMNNISATGELCLESIVKVADPDGISHRYRVEEGDVLFNNRNSAELVGKTTVIDSRAAGYTYNNNLVRLRFGSEILPTFAAMQMNSAGFKESLRDSISASTNVAAIYTRDLVRKTLLVPPLVDQHRLIRELHALAEGMGRQLVSAQHVSGRVSVLRRALLTAAFSGRLPSGAEGQALAHV